MSKISPQAKSYTPNYTAVEIKLLIVVIIL